MQIAALRSDDERFFRRLRDRLEGELLTDATTRYLYGTDASYHLIIPRAVARPRHVDDLVAITTCLSAVNADREPSDRIGLIMRSAGTSLVGGCIGRGLVVDVTKYFKRVLDLDVTRRRATVQPGVTYDEFNRFLAPHRLMFAPNPASGAACELGGMWANNASGTRHVKYGPTRDWVRSISAVSAEGEVFRTGPIKASRHWPPRGEGVAPVRWVRELWPLVRDHQAEIREFTPRVSKNASGYALDRLWDGEHFDVTQLLVGSEGTLACFAAAELQLAEIVPHRAVALLLFESWESAGAGVSEVLPLAPVAVEMVDRHLLDLARPRSAIVRELVPSQTETALIVEFEDHVEAAVRERIEACKRRVIGQRRLAFGHRVAYAGADQERLWAVRKSAAMIGHLTDGRRKPVPFIEDCAVRPENLPAYIRAISAVFDRHGVHVAYWGHAGNGNMHVRPALDLTSPDDLRRMDEIMDEVFAIVDRFGGSYTAEHGDGYTHAHKLARKFGGLYPLFKRTKAICDPLGYLNPDKIITDHPDPLTSDLRMGPGDRIRVEAENPAVRSPAAIAEVENCIGLGVCKEFCPSFVALRNEHDLTRGRTNAMRGMMTGAFGDPDRYLRTPEFRRAGDTCLNCKRCAHQCPSQVDEPRHLLLARRYLVQKEGMPFLDRIFSHYEQWAPWGVRLSTLANRSSAWPWLRATLEVLLGIDRRRRLPHFASQTLDDWFRRHDAGVDRPRGELVYFPGCFARYNQPDSIGRNTVHMAELLGYRVQIPASRCSGHALETYGGDLSDHAKHNIEVLEAAGGGTAPILTTCSSCRLSLVKQYPEWFWNDPLWKPRAERIAARVEDAAYFGSRFLANTTVSDTSTCAAYHAPCHALALSELGRPGGQEALKRATPPARYFEVEQHCSGMGGTFGFKRIHREITSINAGRMTSHLEHLPAGTVVYTDCPSCRLALEETLAYPTDHPVNAVYRMLQQEVGSRRGGTC
jgi:FAD/FMN-containing dehydrogenase/Fe-S oxidoreductase